MPYVLSAHSDGGRRYSQVQERGVISLVPEEQAPAHVLARVAPRLVLRGQQRAHRVRDVLCLGPLGSRDDYLTVTFGPPLLLTTGCFTGTLDDFVMELEGKLGPLYDEYRAAVDFIRTLSRTRTAAPPQPPEDDLAAACY